MLCLFHKCLSWLLKFYIRFVFRMLIIGSCSLNFVSVNKCTCFRFLYTLESFYNIRYTLKVWKSAQTVNGQENLRIFLDSSHFSFWTSPFSFAFSVINRCLFKLHDRFSVFNELISLTSNLFCCPTWMHCIRMHCILFSFDIL